MNCKLRAVNGRVRYVVHQNQQAIRSNTRVDTALWMLRQGKPQKSNAYPGYPIAVTVRGDQYFFAGTWMDDEPPMRMKDAVCSNDYSRVEC